MTELLATHGAWLRSQQYLARLLAARQAALGMDSTAVSQVLLAFTAANFDDLPAAVSLLETRLKLLEVSSPQGPAGDRLEVVSVAPM